MRTLLENITFIKGVEYLIVVAFCLTFVALWILIHKDRKTVKKIVLVLIPLSLIFAGCAIAVSKYSNPDSSDPSTTIAYQNDTQNVNNKGLNINASDYSTINYGQAIEFHKIMENEVSCSTCHHNDKEIKPCKDCHDKPFSVEPTNTGVLKPGLKAAYHQRCESCHKEKFNGPNSCVNCHTGKSISISAPLIHKLTWDNCNRCHTDNKDSSIVYHDNCLSCHTSGILGATKIPNDHTGRDGTVCKDCHVPVGV